MKIFEHERITKNQIKNNDDLRLLLDRARKGDPEAIHFLKRAYKLRVWTTEELRALNLLLENGVETELTKPFLRQQRIIKTAYTVGKMSKAMKMRLKEGQREALCQSYNLK